MSSRESRAETRIKSGIPRLDYILHGGFLRGGVYAIMGPPGSGKTIFGNQLCFNHISLSGGRCVYVTLLVESHAKMFQHLSGLDFFNPGCIPDKLFYMSGYQTLRGEGYTGLLTVIRKTLKERAAQILIIDGMESAEQFATTPQAFREFIHELQATASLLGCTTFLLSNIRDRNHPENALVDGVVELSDELVGPRAVRELTVHKFRGSDYLRGKHEVEIQDRGMVIHPRTEIQFGNPPENAEEKRVRMCFGIKRLDEMLFGGIQSGSTTALLGAPGTGKTMLGLSFLIEGAKRGQTGVYFGFYEPPPRLMEKAEQVNMPLKKLVDEGKIELIWQPPLEHMMDALAEQLLETIREKKVTRGRLFIDGIEGFRAAAVYQDRMPRFLSAFTNQLRTLDVTTLITEELELFRPEIRMPNPELANVVETVIMLRYVELRSQLYRLLSVMKMRESRYDTSIREFSITDDGIEVADSFASAERILTGIPTTIAAPKKAARAQGARPAEARRAAPERGRPTRSKKGGR